MVRIARPWPCSEGLRIRLETHRAGGGYITGVLSTLAGWNLLAA